MSANVHWEYLYDTSGTQIKAYSLTSGTAVYSEPLKIQRSEGFAGLEVELTGGADDVDISYEVSTTGDDWYAPIDTDQNDISVIVTALTASAYIVFDPTLAPLIRFKLDPDANCTITVKYIQQETTR